MLIESKIKRPNAPIEMRDGTIYHFKPLDGNTASPHVCDVVNEDHVECLLSIAECYRPARAATAPPIGRAPAPVVAEADDVPSAAPVAPPADLQLADQHRDRIAALVASTVPDIRAAIPSITDPLLLHGFLKAEQDGKARNTVLEAIRNRIGALPPVELRSVS